MKKVRIGINGLGRIGRAFLKIAVERPEVEVVAANDLGDLNNLAYLLKYDTAYGPSSLPIKAHDKKLLVGAHEIQVFQEKDPRNIPWGQLGVDVVVESTGFFTTYESCKAHIDAGARKVVISAPVKGKPLPGISGATVLLGINDHLLATSQITSNASCTTNSASPVIAILHEAIGIKKAVLNTTHAYTASQRLVDSPDAKDFRRGRAAAGNIIPSTTGAAEAVTEAIPALIGKFDGLALRVPVISGSIADITFIAARPTTVEEVNKLLREAAKLDRWKKVFAITDEPLVSSDILGSHYASIADLGLTKVVDGDLVKVMAWYDNESGYSHALLEHVIKTANA